MSNRPKRRPPARRPARRGPNVGLIAGIAVGLVVVVVAGILLSGGRKDTSRDGAELGRVEIDGGSLAPLPSGGPDPTVGTTAPTIRATNPGGDEVAVDIGSGTPTVLFFLAHWCPHCQRELPKLVDLASDGVFDEVNAIAVLTGTAPDRPNYPPSDWLDDEGWASLRLFDDGEASAAQAYGLSGYPFMVFLDGSGRVVERLSGEQDPSRIAATVARITQS